VSDAREWKRGLPKYGTPEDWEVVWTVAGGPCHRPIKANWVAQLHERGEVWSIGQLSAADRKALDAEVRAGRAVRTRESWGMISSLKTVWHSLQKEPRA